MALDRNSWLHLAEHIPAGGRARVDHDCGPGRTLLITRDERGLRATCFRCNDSGSAPGPAETLADKLERVRANSSADSTLRTSGTQLPTPMVTALDDWPAPARLWLHKAGLGRAEIGELRAYYHPPTDRVVVPVLARPDGTAAFGQARAVDGRQPKYVSPSVDKGSIVASYGHPDLPPVLTEDLLSAFKVAMTGRYRGVALLGTRLSSAVLTMLMRYPGRVYVALDPDRAGRVAAKKVTHQLRAYGLRVTDVLLPADPKLIHTSDLLATLDGA